MARTREYRVAGIYARRRVGGQWFWWVMWAPPFDGQGREDHWQPERSFVDREAVNEVYQVFEDLYPRYLGNVCLLSNRAAVYHLNRTFPYAEYGLPVEKPVYHVRARWRPSCPSSPVSSTGDTSSSTSDSDDDR